MGIGLLEALDDTIKSFQLQRKSNTVQPLERSLQRSLSKAWMIQGRVFLAKLDTLRLDMRRAFESVRLLREGLEQDWESLFLEAANDTFGVFETPIDVKLFEALEAGALDTLADIQMESTFAVDNPVARDWVKNHGATLITGINEETQTRIATLIETEMKDGSTYDRIASKIRQTFDGFSNPSALGHIRDRAELIAVNEIGTAYEEGADLYLQPLIDAGFQFEKYWIADGSACFEICKVNESDGQIPIDSEFGSGTMKAPGHPGCRCGTGRVRIDTQTDLGEEE